MKHLLLLRLHILKNRWNHMTVGAEINAAILMVVALFFLSGIYFGSWRFLNYLNQVPIIGPLLLGRIMGMIFLTAFSMTAFSAVITAFSAIYFSADMRWLFVTPLSVRQLFAIKSFETIVYSSWMVLAAVVPFLAAYGQVRHAGGLFFLGAAALLVPFLMIAGWCGILVSLLLMRFFPSRRTRDVLLLGGIIIMTAAYVLVRFLEPERLVRPDGLESVTQYLSFLSVPGAGWFPPGWLAVSLGALAGGAYRLPLVYGLLLYGLAAVLGLSTIALAGRIFYTGWADGQSGSIRNRRPPRTRRRSPFAAALAKDLTIFFRDSHQWSQLLLLSGLILVYLFSIHKLPLDTLYLQNMVAFLNVGVISFILAAVALRFVFPAVSIEGKSMWLLRASPLGPGALLLGKAVFGGIPVTAAGLILVTVSNILLHADPAIGMMTGAAALLIAVGLSSMAAGFGALFPRFNCDNVAQVESSAGGLFYMISAMFYIGVNLALWSIPVQNYYRHKFGAAALDWRDLWWCAILIVVVNAVATAVPLRQGSKALEAMES